MERASVLAALGGLWGDAGGREQAATSGSARDATALPNPIFNAMCPCANLLFKLTMGLQRKTP